MKKVLYGLLIFVVLLIGALIAIPYFFKDEIISQVKTAANESLTAKMDFKDVDISVFRHFPQLSLGLEGLEITGTGSFDGVKLVQCERLDVTVDLFSAVFGDAVAIKGLYFNKPDIKVYVLSNGKANYDITKPTPEVATTTTGGSGSPIKLEHYAINDGKILYDDRSLDMRAELNGVQHSGSGELTADIYDLVMKTTVDQLTVDYGGVTYLSKAKAVWDATLGADMANMKFTLKENNMKVNDLEVLVDGWVSLPNDDDILMDMSFGSPANTFKSLLSIIPGAYTKDFEGVQANGSLKFAGYAKGKYNETTYPAFGLNFQVGDADFRYPSLPLGVSNINVDASIKSPTQRLDDMKIDIPKFSLRIGSNPLEGYFHLRTPESDPNVDAKMNGVLKLDELSKAFPMEGVQELAGIINANMTIKAAMSQLDQGRYDEVQMAGTFGMKNISYKSADMPAVRINDLSTNLTPQKVDIQNFDARLGKSDLRASGSINNLLAYFSTTKTMTGNVTMQSSYFDANEWLEEPAATTTTGTPSKVPSDEPPAASEKVFDRWDFMMDGRIGKLKYDVYDISELTMNGHFKPNKMDINSFGLKMGASDLSGNGQILNAWNYLFDNQTVSGTINLNSNYFDMNQFMTDPAATATTTPAAGTAAAAPAVEEIIPVPENMDMTINANFAKVQYTNMALSGLTGGVVVKDRAASLKDCIATILGGQVALNGEYNTQNLAKPTYNVDLAMQNMGFRDAFQTFATVKAIAPIAQLMDGKFNTTLSMTGLLGKDMMPDLNTLSAAGFLETISAILNNFKPMNEIGSKLNVPYLNKMELGNTKNWFEVKDGKVTVKPFDVKVKDIAMKIGGTHGFNQDMSYQIVTKAPRKALGNAANAGLNYLSSEASKYGVSLAQGEYINVRFDLTGTLFNPKVAMKVLGSDGQSTIQDQAASTVQSTVTQAKDSLTDIAQKELNKAKEQANQAVDKAADSLRRIADREAQKLKEQAAQEAKEQAGKVLGKEAGEKVGEAVGDKIGQKAGEVMGDKGQKTVDDAKKKLESWDPFKKKKNN